MSSDAAKISSAKTALTGSPLVVYFSSISENTHKFVQKTQARSLRLPLRTGEETPRVNEPFVLCIPSYGRPGGSGSVPPQAVKFLNVEQNRRKLIGVIGGSNSNLGRLYAVAADKVAAKCHVPVLYRFELMGTAEDVKKVNEGLKELWNQNSLSPA